MMPAVSPQECSCSPEDPTQRCDTLTQVALVSDEGQRDIHVYWRADEVASDNFSLLLVEATSRLFIGAGRFVAILDYHRGVFVDEYHTDLLYGFSFRRDCVLVRSELECFLFASAGDLLGRVPVDPPWEERAVPDGLEFRSPVSGIQLLKWPSG